MTSCVELMEYHIPDKNAIACLSTLCPAVIYSGNSVRSRWYIGERKTFNYLWVYIGSGYGTFKVNGVEFDVQENDFIWIPPDTLHEMRGASEQMHCIWAHLDLMYDFQRSCLFKVPGGVRNLSHWKKHISPPTGQKMIDSVCGLVKLSNPNGIKYLFEELCLVHKLNPQDTFRLAGLIFQMLSDIIFGNQKENNFDIRMEKSLSYIRNHLNENLNVKLMAEELGLSPSYFRSLFVKKYGTSPIKLHRNLRIQKALVMMEFEGTNVSETSDILGYSNVSSFSRSFKDITRISPGKYFSN